MNYYPKMSDNIIEPHIIDVQMQYIILLQILSIRFCHQIQKQKYYVLFVPIIQRCKCLDILQEKNKRYSIKYNSIFQELEILVCQINTMLKNKEKLFRKMQLKTMEYLLF